MAFVRHTGATCPKFSSLYFKNYDHQVHLRTPGNEKPGRFRDTKSALTMRVLRFERIHLVIRVPNLLAGL